jgi:hypothetical protein
MIVRFVVRVAVVLAMAAVTVAAVRAHHSFAAEFDANQPITLTGVVARIDLINPHAWLYVDVKGPDGKVERWNIEMGAPNALIRRGVTRQSVPVGQEVTIEGYRAKDGSRTVNSRTVKLSDGRSLFTGSSGTGAPGEAPR